MEKNIIRFSKTKHAPVPTKGHESDAGYDLTLVKMMKQINDNTWMFDTGIAVELPKGYYGAVYPRSSLSKMGYVMSNSVGIIDNEYRGTIKIVLTKVVLSAPDMELPCKCVQLILKKQEDFDLMEIDAVAIDTNRGTGGFGSTNK